MGQAHLRYLHNEFQIIVPGEYVLCAVTGKRIPVIPPVPGSFLCSPTYWDVDLQEAYLDAEQALVAHQARKKPA